MPNDIISLLELLGTCEFLGIEALKKTIFQEILKNAHFMKYTNVRRNVIDYLWNKQQEADIEYVNIYAINIIVV